MIIIIIIKKKERVTLKVEPRTRNEGKGGNENKEEKYDEKKEEENAICEATTHLTRLARRAGV